MQADGIAGKLYRRKFHMGSATDSFAPVESSTGPQGSWTATFQSLGSGWYLFSYTFGRRELLRPLEWD
jgi:hypothetical protein